MATKKKAEAPSPRGRPSTFSQEIADEISSRLSKGEPLAQICRDEHMPGYRTVYDWQDKHETFSASIAHARVDGYDAIAAECLEIADTPLPGIEETIKADGSKEIRTGDMLGHRKLQIETRLKLLAKWDPKRYGDKMQLSGDKESPLSVLISGISGGALPVVQDD